MGFQFFGPWTQLDESAMFPKKFAEAFMGGDAVGTYSFFQVVFFQFTMSWWIRPWKVGRVVADLGAVHPAVWFYRHWCRSLNSMGGTCTLVTFAMRENHRSSLLFLFHVFARRFCFFFWFVCFSSLFSLLCVFPPSLPRSFNP